jgi:parallel beta-helix repeat protein
MALGIAALGGAGALATALPIGTGVAGAAGCPNATPVGNTGLTAALAATAGQTITTPVNATGCDIGIYVGAGVDNVTINGANVTGANVEGIFAEQNPTALTIENSTVTGNGVAPGARTTPGGGILLAGVSGATITGNTVTNNNGGGILVNDNGPVDTGAGTGGTPPTTVINSNADTVSNNTISDNPGSCAIVYATHNTGGQISGGTISGNTITGTPGVFTSFGPDVGGIVVAAASPSATVSNVSVTNNNITESYEAGIIVHAHAPNDVVTGTVITGNTVHDGNNWGQTNGPPTTVGIVLGVDLLPPAIAPAITATTVAGNTISGQFYGLWISGVSGITTTPANTITVLSGGTAVYTTPAPGTGYWQVASDGGVFNYGTAGFYGSAGGLKLNKPVVGLTPTQDQGGYWLVASDGGIFSYGDATFWGSAGSLKLNAPVVNMASTPYVPGANGAPAAPAGLGYWLVASDGGVFNYGDAGFFGSAGSLKLNKPIVGIAATPDGKGYWLVASDGGIFNYGDAAFEGSAGSLKLNQPVVGISATPTGKGYWLDAADGGIFNYGDAKFFGSAGGQQLNKPVVGIASVGTTTSG